MATEWYRTLFSGLFVEALRRIPFATETEADFIVQQLEPAAGARILDVPCGTGRLAHVLSQRGYAVTGVDLSPEVLQHARQASHEGKLAVQLEERDMRDLPWQNHFDGAFCFGNSFSYLGEAGDREFLAAVHRSLKPGGRFVLETHFVAETIFAHRRQKTWYPFDDMYFLHDTAYDPATASLTSSYIIVHEGKVEKHQAHYHVYTYRELVRLFESVGFRVLRAFGSLKGEPFSTDSQGFWVVAEK